MLYWYGSIFLWLFLTGIGIPPIPEETGIIYAAGVAAMHPSVHWWLAWPLASLGILAADTALYWIGRLVGPPLFEWRWMKRLLKPERRRQLEHQFRDHAWSILLSARLLPPLRTGVYLIAGASKYYFPYFLLADGGYLVAGVGILFWLSSYLVRFMHWIGHWEAYVGGCALGVVILFFFYRYLHRREIRGYRYLPALRPATSLTAYSGRGSNI